MVSTGAGAGLDMHRAEASSVPVESREISGRNVHAGHDERFCYVKCVSVHQVARAGVRRCWIARPTGARAPWHGA
jgi:hypothetical protein